MCSSICRSQVSLWTTRWTLPVCSSVAPVKTSMDRRSVLRQGVPVQLSRYDQRLNVVWSVVSNDRRQIWQLYPTLPVQPNILPARHHHSSRSRKAQNHTHNIKIKQCDALIISYLQQSVLWPAQCNWFAQQHVTILVTKG